mmetsp:Transcript_15599/g.21875  ORF Transcript_15599/g.21875 Transcript_15599/m.21875 type:complete len:215 (-) Transcript_15599:231-875(-)
MLIRSGGNVPLFDTYHGVYISVKYFIRAKLKRGMLQSSPETSTEFYVEVPTDKKIIKSIKKEESKRGVNFTISPAKIRNITSRLRNRIPNFLFEGNLTFINCNIDEPFKGELVIRHSERKIKSIELQLVRVERTSYAEGEAREATEVQNIQIADGFVVPNMPIPIHMIFPKHFSCCSMRTKQFQIDFEVNLNVIFQDNHVITENFPIRIHREEY